MTSGRWSGSRRRAELPPDWPDRRRKCAERAGGRCECTGWCNRHDGRCTSRGSDADHRGSRDDHDDLQWLCAACHKVKTQMEAVAARAWRYARLDNSEPHPGLQPRRRKEP